MNRDKDEKAEKPARVKKRKEIMDGKLRVSDMVITDEFVLANTSESIQKIVAKLLEHPGDALLVANLEENHVRVKGIVTGRTILQAIADGRIKTDISAQELMNRDIMEVNLSDSLEEILPALRDKQPQAVIVTNDAGNFQGYFSPTDCELASARLKFFEDLS